MAERTAACRPQRAGPLPPRWSPDTSPHRLSAVISGHVKVFGRAAQPNARRQASKKHGPEPLAPRLFRAPRLIYGGAGAGAPRVVTGPSNLISASPSPSATPYQHHPALARCPSSSEVGSFFLAPLLNQRGAFAATPSLGPLLIQPEDKDAVLHRGGHHEPPTDLPAHPLVGPPTHYERAPLVVYGGVGRKPRTQGGAPL